MMPAPIGDFMRFTMRGNILGGETWSCTHYQVVTGLISLPTSADVQTASNTAETAAALLWAGIKAKCSAETSFTGMNTAFIRNGVTVFTTQTDEAAPIPGTAAAHLPVYIARVVTLQTARSGRSYRGRMYMPYNGTTFAAGAVLWPSDAANLALVAAYLNNCASAALDLSGSLTAGPVIYSQTTGDHEPVTRVRWDNKPDTQRGREKSIAATVFDTHSVP